MYDDHPFWQVYMNAMECLYKNHPIKIDIAGTVESINKIDKETLYTCYNTFYTLSNMIMVVSGDFVPEELLKEIKKRLIKNENTSEIKRIYPEEPEEIEQPASLSVLRLIRSDFLEQRLRVLFQQTNFIGQRRVKEHIRLVVVREDVRILAAPDLWPGVYRLGS
jgi:predicted Zn-dependent peptidase